jgi:hypothetical protein
MGNEIKSEQHHCNKVLPFVEFMVNVNIDLTE